MIVFVSDFDLRGSGYMNIAIALCNQLVKHGKEVMALGIGYTGGEHSWPFTILPVDTRQFLMHVPAMLQNIQALAQQGEMKPVEAIVVALDIPMQERMLMLPQRSPGVIPYIGIFPVESGPLCQSWANVLASMDNALVISKFGLEQMKNAGVNGSYLPVGLDTESWRRPTRKERAKLRESMGFTEDQLVVLTVADNQERKNLSAAMDIIAETADREIDVQWMLVTRVNSPVGWKLDDMAIQKGIMDRFMKFERGLPHDRLWTLYSIADAFLLSSKAEGLCMPIIEAMAVGTPVVATDCTAVPEHVFENPADREGKRGFVMDVAFLHQDPWGNSYRSYVDSTSGADQLESIYELMKAGEIEEKIIIPAREYAESRTWDRCGKVLIDEIDRAITKQVIPPTPAMAGRVPPTVPQVIPIAEEDMDE